MSVLGVPAVQAYRFANGSPNRRRAIRCIFPANALWKFRSAAKDAAAVAHPGAAANGKNGKNGKKRKLSTMSHKVFHDVRNAAFDKLPSTS
ncbi:hypothetical protein CHX27_04770 [Flavobacterium aurantiibacter]|uniref:Uncharacterized protein n=1 Tax=Flavobacterium aurantiibacter TaxID=2023067 RepID=A0A255ZA89_9FLAO|nr:hypothetical protein CHX27_15055 [Flavobacterium aurantiibacter]OYQ46152.1 hypothetical protein CHX27_04770 [Flavobacterium aurantiibacter]